MPDYVDIANGTIAPESPITSELVTALRDNPQAIAEGEIDAPRNFLGSFERLVAGSQIRATFPNINLATESVVFRVGFVQSGTVRFTATRSNTLIQFDVIRLRGGVETTVLSGFTGHLSTDVSVLPGDVFTVEATSGSGAGVVSVISIRTDGQDLWPAEGLFGYLVNNRTLT